MDRFVFWGLFLMFGLVVVAYGLWMAAVERAEQRSGGEAEPDARATGEDAAP